jgi:hypothetical protein
MKKLKLSLDEIVVESYATAKATSGRGTVQAAQETEDCTAACDPECTCQCSRFWTWWPFWCC